MKIKKGDKVIVIAGKDKGTTGVVSQAFPALDKVVVDGVNIAKRHQKARLAGQTGQIVEKAMPMHVSNVAVVDPKTGKATRIGIKREDGKRTRIAKKSQEKLKN